MGGFHGGHGHSGGGFHGGGGFHSSGSHFSSSSRYTGSGSHYGGHSGGGGNNPLSGLIVGIIGIVISSLVTFFLGFDFEMIYFFIVSVVVFFVSLGRLISDSAKIKKALKDDENVENSSDKVYEVVQVDTKRNRITTRALKIVGVIFLALGALFAVLFHTNSTTATITKTSMATDYQTYQKYEKYDFEYIVNGVTYTGEGDDDLVWNGYEYEFDIEIGEEYPIYYYMVNPSSYSFSREPFAVLYIAVLIIGGVLFIVGIVLRKKYLHSIEYVGDLNNDGKINEEDLVIYQQRKKDEKLKELAEANRKYINCPFCDAKIKREERTCPFCGGTLDK